MRPICNLVNLFALIDYSTSRTVNRCRWETAPDICPLLKVQGIGLLLNRLRRRAQRRLHSERLHQCEDRADSIPLLERHLVKVLERIHIINIDTLDCAALTSHRGDARIHEGVSDRPPANDSRRKRRREHIRHSTLEEGRGLSNIAFSRREIIERTNRDHNVLKLVTLIAKTCNNRAIDEYVDTLSNRGNLVRNRRASWCGRNGSRHLHGWCRCRCHRRRWREGRGWCRRWRVSWRSRRGRCRGSRRCKGCRARMRRRGRRSYCRSTRKGRGCRWGPSRRVCWCWRPG